MNKKINRNTLLKIFTILAISIAFFCAYTFLFNAQIFTKDGSFRSDIKSHIKFAINGTGYSFLYSFMKIIYDITGSEKAIAVFHSLMMIGTWFCTGKLIDVLYDRKNYFTSTLIALPPMIASAIYLPVTYEHYYTQQLLVQPYHNITYTGMRLFAVIAMIAFFKIFEEYLEKIKWQHWLLLAGMLTIATSIKPNFFLGFAFTLLIFLIIDFFTTKFQISKFSKMLTLGYTVFPSLFIMWWQSQILYSKPVEDGGSGIAIVWGKNFVAAGFWLTLIKLMCSLLFPILVAIFNRKNLKRIEKFTYLMYVVQLAVVMLFVETGSRAKHGNFYWGLYCAGFFLFAIAFARFVENLRNYKDYNRNYIIMGALLSAAHFISGIAYFIQVMSGAKPYSI